MQGLLEGEHFMVLYALPVFVERLQCVGSRRHIASRNEVRIGALRLMLREVLRAMQFEKRVLTARSNWSEFLAPRPAYESHMIGIPKDVSITLDSLQLELNG